MAINGFYRRRRLSKIGYMGRQGNFLTPLRAFVVIRRTFSSQHHKVGYFEQGRGVNKCVLLITFFKN